MAFIRKDDTGALCIGSALPVPEPVSVEVEGDVNWFTTGGFSGSIGIDSDNIRVFGNNVYCSFNVTGLTAAPGLCTARLQIPTTLVGGVFMRLNQGCGAASGASLADGSTVSGEILPVVGESELELRAFNNSGVPLTPDYGIQVQFQYKWV